MIYVAGIGIAVLIELLLLSKRNKSGSDKILTLWMSVILLHLCLFYLVYTGKAYDYPILLGTEQPLPLLHGVFLYFYVSSLTGQLPRKRNLLAFHFLPAGAAYGYLVTFFVLPAEKKIDIYSSRGAGYDVFGMVMLVAITLSGVVYVAWSAFLLKRHERNIRDHFSDLQQVNLLWLRILTFGMGGIWILVALRMDDSLIYAAVVLFVFLIGFFGARQANIFTHSRSVPEANPEQQKYQKSGLSEEASDELHQELTRLMTEELLYKKGDLSIDDLAAKIGIHPNHLSQVINQKEKKNFYDFVNGYRIEEFKRLIALQKNRQFTLLALAYDCGFSSKTSFNRCFRRSTGQTPSQYAATVTKDSADPA